MPNLFENAKKSPTKTAAPKKKSDKVEVEIEGLETYATIKTVTKALEGLFETVKADVNSDMVDQFVLHGNATSFTGTEGDATASMQLRKRSEKSVLSADEQALLEKNGVSMETIEDQRETYVINPDYKDDEKLLAKVSTAISKVKGVPADFIVHQEQKARVVTTATSIDEVFAGDPKMVDALLAIVAVPAIRAKLNSGDISDAIAKLEDILA